MLHAESAATGVHARRLKDARGGWAPGPPSSRASSSRESRFRPRADTMVPVAEIRIRTELAAPVEVCFDLSRSIDLHLESMIASKERAVAGVTSGLISEGQEVSWEARHFGVLWRMTSRITEFEPPHRFVDEMVRGPFASFRHEHLFDSRGAETRMTDVVEFRTRLGPIVDVPAGLYLRRLLAKRNAAIRTTAESGQR